MSHPLLPPSSPPFPNSPPGPRRPSPSSQQTLTPAKSRRVVVREVPVERVVLRDRPVPAEAVRAPALCPYACRREYAGGQPQAQGTQGFAWSRLPRAAALMWRQLTAGAGVEASGGRHESRARCAGAEELVVGASVRRHSNSGPEGRYHGAEGTLACKATRTPRARPHDGRMHAHSRTQARKHLNGRSLAAQKRAIDQRVSRSLRQACACSHTRASGAHQSTQTPNTAI
jgi:hypothetical protein